MLDELDPLAVADADWLGVALIVGVLLRLGDMEPDIVAVGDWLWLGVGDAH